MTALILYVAPTSRFSEGKSGSFMFVTSDGHLLVKTLAKSEFVLLRSKCRELITFLCEHPDRQ